MKGHERSGRHVWIDHRRTGQLASFHTESVSIVFFARRPEVSGRSVSVDVLVPQGEFPVGWRPVKAGGESGHAANDLVQSPEKGSFRKAHVRL